MSDIIEFPNAVEADQEFGFIDGSSVIIKAGDAGIITLAQAVYMLDEIKYRLHKMAEKK